MCSRRRSRVRRGGASSLPQQHPCFRENNPRAQGQTGITAPRANTRRLSESRKAVLGDPGAHGAEISSGDRRRLATAPAGSVPPTPFEYSKSGFARLGLGRKEGHSGTLETNALYSHSKTRERNIFTAVSGKGQRLYAQKDTSNKFKKITQMRSDCPSVRGAWSRSNSSQRAQTIWTSSKKQEQKRSIFSPPNIG